MTRSRTGEQGAHFVIALVIIVVVGVIGALGYVFWNNFLDTKNTQSNDNSNVSTEKRPLLTNVVTCDRIADFPESKALLVGYVNNVEACLVFNNLPGGWDVRESRRHPDGQSVIRSGAFKTVGEVTYLIEFYLEITDRPSVFSVDTDHVVVDDTLKLHNGELKILKWKNNGLYVTSTCLERKNDETPATNYYGEELEGSPVGCMPSVKTNMHVNYPELTSYLTIVLSRESDTSIKENSLYPDQIVDEFKVIIKSLENTD